MDRTVWTILGILGILLLGGIFFAEQNMAQKQPEFAIDDPTRPTAQIVPATTELGAMGATEIREYTVEITNTGLSPLVLADPVTSCGCTSAYLTINGQQSPTFEMHGNPHWQGEIPQGESAKMTIIFDPKLHNIHGSVSRAVNIKSNDPERPVLTISFTAEVA